MRRPVSIEVWAGGIKLDVGGEYVIDDGDKLTIDFGDSLPAILDINEGTALVNVSGNWHLIGRKVISADELRGGR